MKTKILIITFIVLLLTVSGYLSLNKKHKTYTIGFITNLDGKNAQVGIDSVKSAKIAYSNFKEKNKPNFDIQFISIDNGFDPEKTIKAYNILKDKTKLIQFGTTTTSFMAIYDDFIKNKGMLGFATLGSNRIKNADDNILKNILDVDDEQQSIANFMMKSNINNILIVREIEKNPEYTQMAIGTFNNFYKGKYEEICFSGVNVNLDDIKKRDNYEKYDAVYVISGINSREVAIVIQTIYNIDDKVKFITLPWGNDDIFAKTLGKSISNVIFTSPIDEDNEEYKKFIDDFRIKEGYIPHGTFNSIIYDTTMILLEAIKNTGSDDPAKIKKYILTHQFTGTTGSIQYNKFGDIEGQLFFTKFNTETGKYEISDK